MPDAFPEAARLASRPRDVVREISLSLEVDNVENADERARSLVSNAGGYIERATLQGGDDAGADLVARVPVRALDEFRREARKLGRLSSLIDQLVDATDRRHDIEARLEGATPEERGRLEAELSQLSRTTEYASVTLNLVAHAVGFAENPLSHVRSAAKTGLTLATAAAVAVCVAICALAPTLLVLSLSALGLRYPLRFVLRRVRARAAS